MSIRPETLKSVNDWKSDDILFCIAGPPGGRQFFLGSSDFGVYEIDTSSETADRIRLGTDGGHQSYVTGLAMAGDMLLSCGYDRKLIWWDIHDRHPVRRITAHDRWIRRLIAMPHGEQIVTISDDMLCKVWDVETGQLVAAFSDHRAETPHEYPSMLYALAVSADGRYLATGDKIGHVAIWDAQSFDKIAELEAPMMYTWDPVKRRHSIGGIRSLAFSPNGDRLAVGGIGTIGNIDHLGGPARLEVFDWRAGQQVFESEDDKRKGLIEQIVWAPDASWILTAGGDHKGFITFYSAETGDLLHQEGTANHIHAFLFRPDDGVMITAAHHQLTQWLLTDAG